METLLQSIDNKLSLILSIMLENKIREENLSDPKQVLYLQERGLKVEEIAKILGKTTNSVSIILTRLRKKGHNIKRGG